MFRPGQRQPAQWLRDGHSWPTGELVPDAPVEAVRVRDLVCALAALMGDRGLSGRQTAQACGIDQKTISRVLSGLSYPDVATLARLEEGLGASLWSRE